MSIPESLRYSTEHEWVRVDGAVARVGITEHAAQALGDIVYVSLPTVGSTVVAMDACGELESTKSVSDLFAPVTGTVTAVNEGVVDDPESIGSDPYGEGWLFEVELAEVDQIDALLDAESYGRLIAD